MTMPVNAQYIPAGVGLLQRAIEDCLRQGAWPLRDNRHDTFDITGCQAVAPGNFMSCILRRHTGTANGIMH
ncbi:uncharacterized protein ARMOST_12844 [Armillaria ostoyae]|uniref:Uncharacterized protein n=1 Tax=Armillaria ostoyae TaxID=47428 RepID=A0A284RL36_ARMOS|nr:uncharacterized protein ARMOST_12844 [Armillaria ostoyae]